jgi:glutamate synthase (NADPH/NADH) small chain
LFRRVAIIGSGPAGLACAQQLARAGYTVTVFEQADRAGGLLRYGIPDFRLEKRVLDRRLTQLQAEGVRFRTGVHVGTDPGIEALRRSGHAVVLACGARRPRDLDVPGRNLRGIHFALDYLQQQNRRVAGEVIAPGDTIDAAGKNVVVIGGGDTGGDCVGTAIRQGARQVFQLQYHDCPPAHLDRLQFWPEPVPEWQLTDHDTEGCQHVWGCDTVAFEGRRGMVRALLLQRLRWARCAAGTLERHYRPGMIRRLPAELVLLALGYAGSGAAGVAGSANLQLDARDNVAASVVDYHTSIDGIFACGDTRRGQSLVVWAIREGRQCARAVDIWLTGSSDLPRD